MSMRCSPCAISCAADAGRKIGPELNNVYANKFSNKDSSCISPEDSLLQPPSQLHSAWLYRPFPCSLFPNPSSQKTPRIIPGETSNSDALSIAVTLPRKNDAHPPACMERFLETERLHIQSVKPISG